MKNNKCINLHQEQDNFCTCIWDFCEFCNYELDFDKLLNANEEQKETLNEILRRELNLYYDLFEDLLICNSLRAIDCKYYIEDSTKCEINEPLYCSKDCLYYEQKEDDEVIL